MSGSVSLDGRDMFFGMRIAGNFTMADCFRLRTVCLVKRSEELKEDGGKGKPPA